jgi:hypothetical protein
MTMWNVVVVVTVVAVVASSRPPMGRMMSTYMHRHTDRDMDIPLIWMVDPHPSSFQLCGFVGIRNCDGRRYDGSTIRRILRRTISARIRVGVSVSVMALCVVCVSTSQWCSGDYGVANEQQNAREFRKGRTISVSEMVEM